MMFVKVKGSKVKERGKKKRKTAMENRKFDPIQRIMAQGYTKEAAEVINYLLGLGGYSMAGAEATRKLLLKAWECRDKELVEKVRDLKSTDDVFRVILPQVAPLVDYYEKQEKLGGKAKKGG